MAEKDLKVISLEELAALPKGLKIKKLLNFKAEFLSVSTIVKPIRYLEVPSKTNKESSNSRPLPLKLNTPGSKNEFQITDTGKRAAKLKKFEKDCSFAYGHLFFGGEGVASDREILASHGITHVVNCVRLEHPNYFEDELNYLSLFLQDSGSEDILSVLYDVFDFIEDSKIQGGNAFVHCSQGVSRSAALVIAYVMWKTKLSFEYVKTDLKQRRGVVDPNVNFSAQLMFWEKRLLQENEWFVWVYRIAPQSRNQPHYLVPKIYTRPMNCSARRFEFDVLDPRGVFVVHGPSRVFVWIGNKTKQSYITAGRRFARQLERYENAPLYHEVKQGEEPSDMCILLGGGCLPAVSSKDYAREHAQFTSDYDLYIKRKMEFSVSCGEQQLEDLSRSSSGIPESARFNACTNIT